MREWIEKEWGVQVVTWAQPVDETSVLYEVIVEGELVRADSVPLLIAALAERRKPFLRLVA